MGDRAIAISAVSLRMYIKPLELAMMLLPFQGMNHFIHKIINIKQLKFYTRIIDLYRQLIGYVIAESGYRTVIVWTTPLAIKVRKAID